MYHVLTTGFTVHVVTLSDHQMFNVNVNATKSTNIKLNSTDYKISGLTPGACYSIKVTTIDDKMSNQNIKQDICLCKYSFRTIELHMQIISHNTTQLNMYHHYL